MTAKPNIKRKTSSVDFLSWKGLDKPTIKHGIARAGERDVRLLFPDTRKGNSPRR